MIKQLFLGLVIAALAVAQADARKSAPRSPHRRVSQSDPVPEALAPTHAARADFQGEDPPADVRHMADWVMASADNSSLPFVIIDKKDAEVFVFDRQGQILGMAPVLLGQAVGDDSAPGVGNKKLSAIPPRDQTTPAGRFVAYLGHGDHKQSILWVDHKDNVALHRVVRGRPGDHRLQRLATPGPRDKRITFGCINVPADFFDQTVLPTFASTHGIVYILPEVRATRDFFPDYYDVDE
ncbi:MAG TPA: hypothetical protein VKB71_02580 [Rhizomicrobium sp.]|nr:hypothetical protein [Rhizomicrobium sp.]